MKILGVANVIRTVWIIKKAGLMVVLSLTPPPHPRSHPAFVHYVNLDLKASYIVHCSYQTFFVFESNVFSPLNPNIITCWEILESCHVFYLIFPPSIPYACHELDKQSDGSLICPFRFEMKGGKVS